MPTGRSPSRATQWVSGVRPTAPRTPRRQGGDLQIVPSQALFNAFRVARLCIRNKQARLLNDLPCLPEPVASRKTASVGGIGPDRANETDRPPREQPGSEPVIEPRPNPLSPPARVD